MATKRPTTPKRATRQPRTSAPETATAATPVPDFDTVSSRLDATHAEVSALLAGLNEFRGHAQPLTVAGGAALLAHTVEILERRIRVTLELVCVYAHSLRAIGELQFRQATLPAKAARPKRRRS